MKYQRFSIPSERPDGRTLAELYRMGWPLLVIISLPPAGAYIWRGFNSGDWGWGFLGLLICSGFTSVLWHGLVALTTEANSSVHHRYEHPLRYWLTIAVWFIGYLISIGAFFCV